MLQKTKTQTKKSHGHCPNELKMLARHSCNRAVARSQQLLCGSSTLRARPMRLSAKNGNTETADFVTRRDLALFAAAAVFLAPGGEAQAITGNPLGFKKELAKKRRKIPESEYSDGPEGLKLYDITVGTGAEAKVGQRVAIHYDVKFRNITFMTSRQGMGVTGGNPLGFDVGQPAGAAGSTLPGIDLGVRGMRVGGQRRLLVPANLAYGERGLGEIPPNATITVDVELLSIKTSPLGYRTKLVEG